MFLDPDNRVVQSLENCMTNVSDDGSRVQVQQEQVLELFISEKRMSALRVSDRHSGEHGTRDGLSQFEVLGLLKVLVSEGKLLESDGSAIVAGKSTMMPMYSLPETTQEIPMTTNERARVLELQSNVQGAVIHLLKEHGPRPEGGVINLLQDDPLLFANHSDHLASVEIIQKAINTLRNSGDIIERDSLLGIDRT